MRPLGLLVTALALPLVAWATKGALCASRPTLRAAERSARGAETDPWDRAWVHTIEDVDGRRYQAASGSWPRELRFVEVVSVGPDGKFEDGGGDDIVVYRARLGPAGGELSSLVSLPTDLILNLPTLAVGGGLILLGLAWALQIPVKRREDGIASSRELLNDGVTSLPVGVGLWVVVQQVYPWDPIQAQVPLRTSPAGLTGLVSAWVLTSFAVHLMRRRRSASARSGDPRD